MASPLVIARHQENELALLPALANRHGLITGATGTGKSWLACAIGHQACRGNRSVLYTRLPRLIDELSLGLAPLVVDSIIAAAEQINREQGTSLLIVEQDVEVSLSHAHRGYVLDTGRITRSDEAQKLLHDDYVRSAYLGL